VIQKLRIKIVGFLFKYFNIKIWVNNLDFDVSSKYKGLDISCLSLFLLVVPLILLHKQNKNFSEDLDKVDEKVEGMGDKVLVSHPGLPDDQLGVEHDEAAEHSQAKPDVSLEQELRSEKDVCESKPHEGGESGHESASKVEILAIRSHQRGPSEAAEDGGGDHEGGGHDAGVHHHGHLEEGAHAKAGQEPESQEHGHPLASVLAIIRGEVEAEGEAHGHQGKEEAASLEDVCEEVDVGPGGGRGDGHSEAGVDILEVGPHGGIKFGVERVQEAVNCCSHICCFETLL